MAETLTYDAGTDTITTEGTLSEEEQDSLQVGEEMEAQQEALLAGKYQNAQELEKAYIELQKKLGDESDTTDESEPESTTSEETEGYLEDGSVNYESVNETYGEKLGDIFKDSSVDPWSINKHFHENNGTITEDMYKSLEGAGLSRSSIDAYLNGVAVESGYTSSNETADLTESDVNSVKQFVGGTDEYSKITQWATDNLDEGSVEAYDNIVATGNVEAIKLAVAGLKAQYENANGYEGRMLTGKPPRSSGDVFRSQAEVVAAISDPKYDVDPAYRQDIIEKLDRSDVKF